MSIPQLRAVCADLERAVRRAARPVASEDEVDAALAKVHGGEETPPADWTEGDWWQRKQELYGWLRHYLALQLAKGGPAADADFIRLKIYAEEPEAVELTSGYVARCYPVTLSRAVRIHERAVILHRCVLRQQGMDQLPKGREVWTSVRLNRERLWQRCALLYEATLPPGSLQELPIDPPVLARWARTLFHWLDGGNRWHREFWRLRWCLIAGWRVVDRLMGAHRWLGIPPWWAWAATAVDEVAIVRAHLAANDERVRALPSLPSAGGAENWGWTGAVSALAEQRHKLASEFITQRSLMSMIAEVADAERRAAVQRREIDKRTRDAKVRR